MSQLVREINEITNDLNNFKAGTLSAEDFQIHLTAYAQTEKRARDILVAWGLAIKSGVPHGSISNHVLKELIGKERIKVIPAKTDRTKDRGK